MSQQRDPWGRFLPGHTGGPGRPKQTHDPAYRTIVEEVVSHEDWRAILEKLKQSALRGDREALKFLAGYLLGRPGLAEPSEDDTASSFTMDSMGPPPPMPGSSACAGGPARSRRPPPRGRRHSAAGSRRN